MANLSNRVANKTALARDLGCNRIHLTFVLSGKRPDGTPVHPSVALAKRIEAATGGVIRWTEFFEDAPAQEPPPAPIAAA